MSERLRVLIADDSPFVCRLLSSYLQSVPDFEVAGTALDGARAIERVKSLRPDVVTLDLEMPEVDGLTALASIMEECPTPAVMISGVSGRAATMTLQALDLGAVDFVLKFMPGTALDPDSLRQEIVSKVRAAAQIRVVRRLKQRPKRPQIADAVGELAGFHGRASLPVAVPSTWPGEVVVIGASTGGPLTLRELLGHLPADFRAAIIIVQHMPPSFTGVLAAQLDRNIPLEVREADDGDALTPGVVLVAPGGYHLLVRPDARVEVRPGPEVGGHCPSIDVTMQSVAQVFGPRARGVVLTGMGADGSLGLLAIHAKGGTTYAQDAATCVVNGMPQRAIERGVVDHVASPWEIAQLLMRPRFQNDPSSATK